MANQIYLITFYGLYKEGYIGTTYRALSYRKHKHLRECVCNNKTPKQKWINNNIQEGYILKIENLDTCNTQDAIKLERYYIAKYKTAGWKLFNSNKGGGGLQRHSDKVKARISCSKQGQGNVEVMSINIKTHKIQHFLSVKEASEVLGVNRRQISRCLHNKREQSGGFQFI